jgi:uncharacterized protein (TIGR03435 family)
MAGQFARAQEIQKPTMMAVDADPDWDVVSVHPADQNIPHPNSGMNMKGSQFLIENKSVEIMLKFAYGVQRVQVINAPGWMETELWTVRGVPNVPGQPNLKQMQILTRKALEERFGLKLHRSSKELSVYAIREAKGGNKMAKSTGDPNEVPQEKDNTNGGVTTLKMTNAAVGDFALLLKFYLDRPIVDQTGLSGHYDFELKWTSDDSRAPTDGSAPPGLFTAIQEQIGLKLEAVKAQTEVLIVDAMERPAAN